MMTFNGRPFDADDFARSLTSAALSQVKAQLHERVSSIRDPKTGEFPVVRVTGDTFESILLHIEGSPELLQLVNERLSPQERASAVFAEPTTQAAPRAFLSFTWDDHDIAQALAEVLQANGIETWWAEWEIRAGDSLRQKIDAGLENCNVFLVLLTPKSIYKPWVNLEMDAGLVRKIESKARFIPIRHSLPPEKLPPLLRGMFSPAIDDLEAGIKQLINDIHGVLKKPPLGPPPPTAVAVPGSRYSPAAAAIAKWFVLETANATAFDPPNASVQSLAHETGLTEDDVTDALYEIGSLVSQHYGMVTALPELYAEFDESLMGWCPRNDALRLATDLINDASFPREPERISERYDWPPRRLNPAIAYLESRDLIAPLKHLNMGPWVVSHMEKTDATRRFVKSRA